MLKRRGNILMVWTVYDKVVVCNYKKVPPDKYGSPLLSIGILNVINIILEHTGIIEMGHLCRHYTQ